MNGDFFIPNTKHHTESSYFSKGITSIEFSEDDMGGYEYECCIGYLKNLRNTLFKHGFQAMYKLEFSENNLTADLVLCPLENCLFTVAKQCGFKITDQFISENIFIYTLCSDL